MYLLDEACSNLYGNEVKGIKARSIDINDIEGKMTDEALAHAHSDSNYENQILNPYIEEALRSIDDNGKITSSGLGISEQTWLIEAIENNATNGYLQARSIQPTQTYWSKDNTL